MRKNSYDIPRFPDITRQYVQVISDLGYYQESSRLNKLLGG
jgi:hypothetical protein